MKNSEKKIMPGQVIKGEISVPFDKSITHRALMLAAISKGASIIRDPSYSVDCKSTISCLQSLGVPVDTRESFIEVRGVGRQGLRMTSVVLDAGNSGTTLRMLSGILAGQPIHVTIDGDASLRKRPLKRLIQPLKAMGADISSASGENGEMVCPMVIGGRKNLHAISWNTPVASAQVKSAILFAGLNAVGKTSVKEPGQSRDHTERMLSVFGCEIKKSFMTGEISLMGPLQPRAAEITVCRDFSSAAYFVVMGLLLPESEIILSDVGINPTRTGLLRVLERMGAHIQISNQKKWSGEPVGTIEVHHQKLYGTRVKTGEIPTMIDEIPVLAVAASLADGFTVIDGASELKYKESNRLRSVAEGLNRMGAEVTVLEDGLKIKGKPYLHGARVDSFNDHRIAMAMAVAGMCALTETTVMNPECVDISFPGFWELIERNG